VGAESISRIVFPDTIKVDGVTIRPRNPLAAVGGTPPEPLQEVKLFAPFAYRSELARAITADDYASLAEKHPYVQRAAASLRWSGSGYDVLVVIDPLGTDDPDPALVQDVQNYLEPYRRVGYDVIVEQGQYVPLDLALTVCVEPHYLSGHVKAALLKLFSNKNLSDGTRGFFHPDNLTFGDSISVSAIVAAAQAVQGVMSVTVDKLERLGQGPNQELQRGVLLISPMEIAQLDNDPNFPERGIFTLTMRGGR
jgi:predicted phage baseplate assembly protein